MKRNAKEQNKTKAAAAKRKKELNISNKVSDKLAPILSQLQQCKERFTQDAKKCLPPCQTLDMEHHLAALTELSSTWSLVVKGSSTMKAEELNDEAAFNTITQAKTAATAFKTSLAAAETIVAKRASGCSSLRRATARR